MAELAMWYVFFSILYMCWFFREMEAVYPSCHASGIMAQLFVLGFIVFSPTVLFCGIVCLVVDELKWRQARRTEMRILYENRDNAYD